MINKNFYDVAIIGGSFVGASLAVGLAQLGLSCVVLDKNLLIPESSATDNKDATNYKKSDNRGLALSVTSKKILQNLGIWSVLRSVAHPINTVHVSKQGRFGITKLDGKQLGETALGYLLAADTLLAELHAALDNTAVTKFWPIENLRTLYNPLQQIWEISFSCANARQATSQLTVEPQLAVARLAAEPANFDCAAKLLIAADGADSTLRQQQGIQADSYDYAEIALVTNVQAAKDHYHTAYERFTDLGTLALLPFGTKRLKLVWTVAAVTAAELLTLSKENFLAKVQQFFGYRLGKFIDIDPLVNFPIKQIKSTSLVGERLLIIGNAANTMHPLAAQGLNLGLRDVAVLLKILANAQVQYAQLQQQQPGCQQLAQQTPQRQQALDIGSPEILAQYAAARKVDHAATQNFTHSVHQIFNSKLIGAGTLCSLGLVAANLYSPLNKWIIKRGLGTV